MTDLRGDGSDERPSLALELIAAGRGERAGRAARLLAANALLTAGVSATGVAPAAVWVTTLKWCGISVLVLGSAGLLSNVTSNGDARTVASVAAARSSPPPVFSLIPAHSAAVVSPAPLPLAEPSQRRPRVAVALPAPVSAAVEAAAAASVPKRDLRLREELDALREARQALAAGAPARALAVLGAKADGFSLLPVEADIVRVEALRSSGDESGAQRRARELLREHGAGPYGARLRALAAE